MKRRLKIDQRFRKAAEGTCVLSIVSDFQLSIDTRYAKEKLIQIDLIQMKPFESHIYEYIEGYELIFRLQIKPAICFFNRFHLLIIFKDEAKQIEGKNLIKT